MVAASEFVCLLHKIVVESCISLPVCQSISAHLISHFSGGSFINTKLTLTLKDEKWLLRILSNNILA